MFCQYASRCILAPLNFYCCLCNMPCHASYLFVHHAMCIWWLFTMLFVSFRVASLVSFGFVPELSGFIRLRPFVFFMDPFFFLAESQARCPYPRNQFYIYLLVVPSIAMLRYLPLAISCLPYCHVKPLTHLPSKPLFGYVTAFAQPLL